MNSIGIKIFLIIETVLYLSFLSLDISGFFTFSSDLKYASIFLLFFYILIKTFKQGGRQRKGSLLIPSALAFSAAADVFLLFTQYYLPGLIAFLAVQTILCLRLHQLFWPKQLLQRRIFYTLVPVLGLFAIALTVLFLLEIPVDEVTVFALLYFLFFLGNVVTAVYGLLCSHQRNQKGHYLFATGLILFFFCDIHVGLYNAAAYVPQLNAMPQIWQQWISLAMWLFYLPGQTLIGLSNLSDLPKRATLV